MLQPVKGDEIHEKITTLFITFLKIGAFTFGGGYAMVALLESEFVSYRRWLDKDEFIDMIAIAESTPGPMAINSATYIGYRICGFWGALAATVAVSIPSFIIIYIISLFLDQFMALTVVQNAFRGIQACIIYLVFTAGLKLLRRLDRTFMNIFIVSAVTILMILFSVFAIDFSSILFIFICGAVGVAVWLGGEKNDIPEAFPYIS